MTKDIKDMSILEICEEMQQLANEITKDEARRAEYMAKVREFWNSVDANQAKLKEEREPNHGKH